MMRWFLLVGLAVTAMAYQTGSEAKGCKPGWGCSGGAASSAAASGTNQRVVVADHTSAGRKKFQAQGAVGNVRRDYWWQTQGTFNGIPSRTANTGKKPSPSAGQKYPTNAASAGSRFPNTGASAGGSKFPHGGVPLPSGGPFPSGNQFPSGGSSLPAGVSTFPAISTGGNSQFPVRVGNKPLVNRMGRCPANFICVHWQLCGRNGQIIVDGMAEIFKSIRNKPSYVNNWKGCGGEMYCCGVTPGYTTQGVITSISSQIPGSVISQNTLSPGSGGSPGIALPSGCLGGSGTGCGNQNINSGVRVVPGAQSVGGNYGSSSSGAHSGTQFPGSSGGFVSLGSQFPSGSNPATGNKFPGGSSGSYQQTGTGSFPSGSASKPISGFPSGSSSSQGFGSSGSVGVQQGSGFPSGSNPASSNRFPGGTSGNVAGGYQQSDTGIFPSGSGSSQGLGSQGSVSVQQGTGFPLGSNPAAGNKFPGSSNGNQGGSYQQSGGFGSSGSQFPSGSNQAAGSKFPGGSSGSYQQSGNFPGGSASKPISGFPSGSGSNQGFGSSGSIGVQQGSGFPSGSNPAAGNQFPGGSSGSVGGSYQQTNTGSFQSGSQSQPGSAYPSGSGAVIPQQATRFPQGSNSASGSASTSGNYGQSGGSGVQPSNSGALGPFNQDGLSTQVVGSQVQQQLSMNQMMGMMMGMNGLPLIGGSCSAGTYCVPYFQCNEYDGFIIMDPKALAAVRPDSPKVPQVDCILPRPLTNPPVPRVCCQRPHPFVGPNGQLLD